MPVPGVRCAAHRTVSALTLAAVSVVVAAAATPSYGAQRQLLLSDSMSRVAGFGWGAGWRMPTDSARHSQVDGSVGVLQGTPGHGLGAEAVGLSARDAESLVRVSLDRLPTSGSGVWFVIRTRVSGAAGYEQRLRVLPSGQVLASTARRAASGRTVLLGQERATGVRLRDGQQLYVRARVAGTRTVLLASKVWLMGTPEPARATWSRDGGAARLAVRGGFGLWAYLPPRETAVSVRVDAVRVADIGPAGTSAPALVPAPAPVAPEPVAPSPTPTAPAAPTPPAPPESPPSATPDPTPAPAPNPAPPSDSGTWVKPDAGSTGVPDGTTLTDHWGDLVITTPGGTYDSLDVHGFVRVEAPDVTIRRSLIRGGVATGNIGLVTDYGQRNFTIEDSTLVPDHPSVWLDAIKGNNYTARRIEASGTVDTAKVHGDNVRIESSWFHDTVSYESDPNQGGGPTHNDGVQILGGTNITIVGNNISVPVAQNAAIQVTQGYDWVSSTTITHNWLDGAGCTVNINDLPKPTLSGLSFTSNRFGRDHRYVDCALLAYPGVEISLADNAWDDNGLPIRLRLRG